MRTRTSARLTNDNFSVLRPDVNDSFVLSSDESEAENFQVKYGPRNLGGLKEEKKSDTPKEIAKGRRGLRGKLEKINTLPLDIVLEIYSHLDPLDVLRLFRTSKDIRSFLMTRTNAIVWRKARSNVPDLPPLPLDLSEPQYASLAFESYCHICLRKPCENVFWQCRVRCCTRCFSTAFSSRPNLHSIWHRSYAGTFLVFDKIAPYIPYVSVTPWKGPWGGEDKVYFPPNIRALRHEYRRLRKGELILEDWVSQKKYRFECLMTVRSIIHQAFVTFHIHTESIELFAALTQLSHPQDPLTPDTWPPGPGQLLVPQQPNEELTKILNQIDPVRIEKIINKLVSFGTRSTLSSQTDPVRGIGASRDWIASQMRDFAATSGGRMTVDVPSYTQTAASQIPTDTVISNIVATLKGSVEPDRVYVVSGHYDSRNTNDTDGIADAPGADDDGSGVAISMELARIMATHDSKSTIMFVAVAGEEQGLYGSNFMAQTLRAAGIDVQGMLDNDIVGASKGSTGPAGDTNSIEDPFSIRMFVQGVPTTETLAQIQSRVSIGAENDSPARQLVQTIWRPDRFLRGGDHESFLKAGYPAVRFTEPNEDFAHQHQNVRVENGVQFGDLAEFCDFEFNARVGKVNGAVIWSLAQAPGTPTNVAMDTSVLTNNSTLTWQAVPNAASYEIVWRASDVMQWTHVIPVGNVTKATVLLPKDNAQLAVRAVGSDGFKSPAGFPFSG
ncbi:hypothetical protein D9757_008818 [Collybiopsis confluens]|uniref:Peptide hydrolase n=1 Tax=Collybiopsis confluens TaxID=2823264 RepID=A0A8H5H3R2_9AGAR|nr:hypothetical protein D9757_008818 [Collybiopsis confluens]